MNWERHMIFLPLVFGITATLAAPGAALHDSHPLIGWLLMAPFLVFAVTFCVAAFAFVTKVSIEEWRDAA